MNKAIISIVLLSLLLFSAVGCQSQKPPSLDASFMNVRWTRATDTDTEFIYFSDDGQFSYYCACGNPVADSDLCEGYTFDEESLTVTLKYTEKTEESLSKITIKSCTDNELVLDADGRSLTFTADEKIEDNESSGTVTYKDRTYALLEYNSDIFYYDLKKSIDYEDNTVYPLDSKKWNMVYRNGELYVLESDLSDACKYYGSADNYSWSVSVYPEDAEEALILPLSLTDGEKAEILSLNQKTLTDTVLFDDIELHATLELTSCDGLVCASANLCQKDGRWYWRSEEIDETKEGWPEYIVKLPKSVNDCIEHFLRTDK